MDLDKMIIQKRNTAMRNHTLDTELIKEDILDEIMSDIEMEAQTLKDEVSAPSAKSVMRNSARPDSGDRSVDLKGLLLLDDSEFITECYRQLLGREPDTIGFEENLRFLRIQKYSKLEIVYSFCSSEEGREYSAKVQGLERRIFFLRVLRKSFRIPLLGRVIRYAFKFFRMNKTIYQMMVWNLNEEKSLTDQIIKTQTLVEDQMREMACLRDQLNNQRQKQMRLEMRLKRLEEKLQSYSLLEENVRNNNKLIAKHDAFVENYPREDGKLLQKLSVDWCNIKADFCSASSGRPNADAFSIEETSGSAAKAGTANASAGSAELKKSKDAYDSIDYFEFENRFRGSREHIKKVQKIYLPYFKGRNQVVDLGCGRGEFVELLREEHIGVEGVDLYQPYVEFCNIMNLPVKQGDAIQYLRQKSGVDGIFAGQVVEHLTIEQIIELCHVAYEKLEPGCYLILETPNPRSLAIYTESFYMDPSHNHPVHPNTLQYIVEKEGFSQVEVLYTDSSRLPYTIPPIADADHEQWKEFDRAMERVSDLLYGSQDYAVIARK